MSHFAQIDKDTNIVVQILVLNNEVITVDGVESEQKGIEFLQELIPGSEWIQTSYNGSFRKNFAVLGGTYDKDRDAFIPPRPTGNYTFNEETCLWDEVN